MLDDAPTRFQRAQGEARVALGLRGGRTCLEDLHQSGSAKAMLPRTDAPEPQVVFLNTSGGLTGDDKLHFGMTIGAGARATGATQTAERVYRAGAGLARVRVHLKVGDGAHLDWMPQETILFDGAGLDRVTRIDLGERATCLSVETLVFGRLAMGEVVQSATLTDRREIWRAGHPLMIETLKIDAVDLAGDGPAGLAGARAISTIVYVAPDAEDRLAMLRRELRAAGHRISASAWDGRLVLRAASRDPKPLRAAVASALCQLRLQPLPRVWQL